MDMLKRITIIISLISVFAISGIASAEDLAFGGLNIGGDTVYFPMSGEIRFGIGATLATYKNFIELRAALIPSTGGNDNKMGAGLSLNISEFIKQQGGTWMLKGLKSSIGIMGFVNFASGSEKKIEPAIVLNVIKVEF